MSEIAGEPFRHLCFAVAVPLTEDLFVCIREEDHPGPHRAMIEWDPEEHSDPLYDTDPEDN